MEKRIKDKVERSKAIAEILKKSEKAVYIVDYEGNYYFARIMKVATDFIRIQSFAPESRSEEIEEIYWINIKDISEYKKKGAR